MMNPKPTLTFNPTTLNTQHPFSLQFNYILSTPTQHSKTRIFSSIKLHIVNPTTLNTHFLFLFNYTCQPHNTQNMHFSSIKLHIVNPTTLNTHFLFLFNYTCQLDNTQHTFSLSIQLQKSWTHTHTHTHTHTLSLSLSYTQHPKKNTQHKQPFFPPHFNFS